MRYIGIDPGEGWSGVAILDVQSTSIILRTYVLKSRARSWLQLGNDLLIGTPAVVVAEDFKARPQGYNAFSSVTTARILGMLQYATEAAGCEWHTVPPNDPDKNERLRQLVLGRVIDHWAKSWAPSAHWQHARSAWRVLAEYLFKHENRLLLNLAEQVTSILPTCQLINWSGPRAFERVGDLIAPSARYYLLTPLLTR